MLFQDKSQQKRSDHEKKYISWNSKILHSASTNRNVMWALSFIFWHSFAPKVFAKVMMYSNYLKFVAAVVVVVLYLQQNMLKILILNVLRLAALTWQVNFRLPAFCNEMKSFSFCKVADVRVYLELQRLVTDWLDCFFFLIKWSLYFAIIQKFYNFIATKSSLAKANRKSQILPIAIFPAYYRMCNH